MNRTLRAAQQLKAHQLAEQVTTATAEDSRDLSLISPLERNVLGHTATSLLSSIRSGRYSSRDVAVAFI